MHGSTAFGLDGPDSDVDLKGILVGPARWYHGFQGGPEQIDQHKDHVRYEIRKFLLLASKANPTALEMLYVDPRHHQRVTPAGERLIDARAQFLTRHVGQTFGKYAIGQLKRIRSHRAWLENPPEGPPRDEDYPLLHERKAAHKRWRHYQTWVAGRNPERAALERAHGYDTKHGMHLVRLLRMGLEALQTGTLTVTRPDREELLAIRAGAWSYAKLVDTAEAFQQQLTQAMQRSSLPERVDLDAADALCASLVEEVLADRG